MLPFVGVDGEGGDIRGEDGFTHHRYTMLRIGDDYVTDDYLPFIAGQPKKRIHVAFFFDYDVTMLLRELPEHLLRVLVSNQTIRWGGYEIGYRPRKELTVKHSGRITTINDVGTFFQCRFVTALERWNIGTVEQREAIGAGKEQRAEFGALTSDVVKYNALECMLLEDLMTKFRRTCQIIGYLPARWQGPGQLAKAMFKKHGIPKTDELPEPPPGVWEMALAAYYGGRFETSAVGPVKGPVEGWDINSAYPYAATLLPCLLHGSWRPTRDLSDRGMYRVTFTHKRDQTWYGLPVRTRDGAIHFPRNGAGWYHGIELRSALSLGAQIHIIHGWEHVSGCTCEPFSFMHRLYSVRQGIGKSEAGIALKLAMNSAYGICAQSVGKAPYANPVWAGLFTAITRAALNNVIAKDPYSVYMLATDGLYARPGLSLPTSETLGGWEKTTYPDGIHIVQPGVYFTGHKDTCRDGVDCHCGPKTRGVPQTAVLREEQALRQAWTGTREAGLSIKLRQFVGLRLGLARNSPETVGEWMPVQKRISYDWETKRRPHTLHRGVEAHRTMPYDGNSKQWSTPYSKHIGGNIIRDMDRLDFVDQPDWAETLSEVL